MLALWRGGTARRARGRLDGRELYGAEPDPLPREPLGMRAVRLGLRSREHRTWSPGKAREAATQLPKLQPPLGGRWRSRDSVEGREADHPGVPASPSRKRVVRRHRRQRAEARPAVGPAQRTVHSPWWSRALRRGAGARPERHGPRAGVGRPAHRGCDEGRAGRRPIHVLELDPHGTAHPRVRIQTRRRTRWELVGPGAVARPAR